MWNQLLNRIEGALDRLVEALLTVIPALLVIIVSVSVGILIGFGLRALLELAFRIRRRETAPGSSPTRGLIQAAGLKAEPRRIAGLVSFWAAIVVALVVGVNALEPGALKNVMTEMVSWIPRVLTSVLLFVLGLGLAALARRSILIAAVNAGLPWARIGSRTVHVLVLSFFFAIALENLGVGRSILVAAFSVVSGGIVLALALAFGLGARDIARRYLERKLNAEQEDTGIRHV